MKFKTLGLLLVLILFLVPSILSLLQPGFFQTDDGEWMVIRFSAFYQALSDGQFPVRFLGRLNYGYGYPVANFLYPGFMYIATPLQILGLGFVSSVKIVLMLSMLGGGVFAYLWLSRVFDKTSAIIGAIFFTYTPYHLFDLYKRGSVGEVLSIGILPFIFWQIERNSIFWIAIGIFLLILAHNTLAVLFLPLVFGYMALSAYVSRVRYSTLRYVVASLVGIGMASFFWIPALAELKYTHFSDIQISQWENYFADTQLIGISSFTVFTAVVVLIILKKIEIKKHRLTALFLAIGVLSAFLASPLSSPIWNFLPTSFIQFPFRFLSLLIPSIAFLAACAVSVFKGRNKIVFAVVLVASILVSSFPFLAPKEMFDKGEGFYSTNEATTTVKDEYMPVWVLSKPEKRFEDKVVFRDKSQEAENLTYSSKTVYFETSSDKDSIARINTVYYPGWQARINGKMTDIGFSNDEGVMDLVLPMGKNKIELNFTETPLRLASDLISLLSLFALILLSSKGIIKAKLVRQKNG